MEQLELILTDFQGPLDLLLHLIKKSQINIYDIPIAEVTQQYLDYLHQMQSLQLDIAGEYLVMAATLMRIKSQLLLPQTPVLDDDLVEDVVDPRTDLVAQLLTYQAYQVTAQDLQELEQQRRQLYSRPPSTASARQQLMLRPGTYSGNDLALCLVKLLDRLQQQTDLAQLPFLETISVTQAQEQIMQQLQQKHRLSFQQLLQHSAQVEEVVTKFMGLLELVKDQAVLVTQIDDQSDIWVKLR